MKKISAKKYARVLYEATKDLDKEAASKALVNFVKILARNRHLKLAERIMAEYQEYSNIQEGIVEAEVTVARALSSASKEALKNKLKKNQAAKEVVLKETVDKNLIGGMIIKINDTVLNASLKNNLNLLKQSLVR